MPGFSSSLAGRPLAAVAPSSLIPVARCYSGDRSYSLPWDGYEHDHEHVYVAGHRGRRAWTRTGQLRVPANAGIRARGTITKGWEVYQTALRFIEWRGGILSRFPPNHYLVDQLDRASSSITLNIAEGAGEWARADRARFYRMARRSATECSAILDVVQARRLEPAERMSEGKELIHRVIAMLTALARSSPGRTP